MRARREDFVGFLQVTKNFGLQKWDLLRTGDLYINIYDGIYIMNQNEIYHDIPTDRKWVNLSYK